MRASQLCYQCVERLLSADLPGGTDGCQGQLIVRRRHGGNHGGALRCGVARSQPAYDIRLRGVAQRRELLDEGGIERLVGEGIRVIERSAAVGPVGVFERGEHRLCPFFGIRSQDDFQSRGADVLRQGGFLQGFGRGEGLLLARCGEPCQQVHVSPRGVVLRERIAVGFGGCGERRYRSVRAAFGQRVVNGLPGGGVGREVGGPFQQRGLRGRKAFLRRGISQQGVRSGAFADQRQEGRFGSRRGDQAPHGVIRKIVVPGVLHEDGSLLGRCTQLEQREQEGLVGFVRRGGDGVGQSGADLPGERLAALGRDVAHYAAEGVFDHGVLAFGGGDEHPGHHPDSVGSGCREFLHQAVERLGRLGRKLGQGIRHDRFGGTLAGILRSGGERHEGEQEYGDE